MLDPKASSDTFYLGEVDSVAQSEWQTRIDSPSARKVLDELRRAPMQNENPRSNDLTETIAIVFLGGFGMSVGHEFGTTGKGYMIPRNPSGNVMVDTSALKVKTYNLDTISPENRAYLGDVHTVQGSGYRFFHLGNIPFGGDGEALLEQMPRLYERSPDVREIFDEICQADLVVLVGSEGGTATYALTHFFSRLRLATKLMFLIATPSRLTARGEIPLRRPAPAERFDGFLGLLTNNQRSGMVVIHSERTAGAEIGDPEVLPALEATAQTTARVLYSWLIPGSLGGSSSIGHPYDLSQVTNPLIGKVAVPSFAKASPSAADTIDLLERGQLAGGFGKAQALMAFGKFPSVSFEESLVREIAALGLKGATYNLNQEVPGGIMAMWIVDPANATHMMDHLK